VNAYLECVIEINPDALAIAEGLDAERRDGKVRGLLHGVPVLVKDVSKSCNSGKSMLTFWVRIWQQKTRCKPQEDLGHYWVAWFHEMLTLSPCFEKPVQSSLDTRI
jgi:hypothetical protein